MATGFGACCGDGFGAAVFGGTFLGAAFFEGAAFLTGAAFFAGAGFFFAGTGLAAFFFSACFGFAAAFFGAGFLLLFGRAAVFAAAFFFVLVAAFLPWTFAIRTCLPGYPENWMAQYSGEPMVCIARFRLRVNSRS